MYDDRVHPQFKSTRVSLLHLLHIFVRGRRACCRRWSVWSEQMVLVLTYWKVVHVCSCLLEETSVQISSDVLSSPVASPPRPQGLVSILIMTPTRVIDERLAARFAIRWLDTRQYQRNRKLGNQRIMRAPCHAAYIHTSLQDVPTRIFRPSEWSFRHTDRTQGVPPDRYGLPTRSNSFIIPSCREMFHPFSRRNK